MHPKMYYTIFIVFNFILTSIFPQLVADLLWFFYAYIKINEATRYSVFQARVPWLVF